MPNLILEQVEYKVDETALGTWKRFLYPNGQSFAEYRSHAQILGLPFVHYTYGRCPETGRRVTARGIIAVGRFAFGVFAIGHVAMGLVAIGQLALGLVLGLGQAATGVAAVGQLAVAVAVGFGQFTAGYVAIGQFGLGYYTLSQLGFGVEVWDVRGSTQAAREFFRSLWPF